MLQLIEKKRNKTNLGLRTLSEASNTDTGRRVSLTSVSSTEGIPKTEMSDSVDSTIHDPSSTIPYSTLAYENEYRKRNRFIDDATLTPDDLYKRKKLRQRNKVAATKCRIKRKARHQLLILVRYQKKMPSLINRFLVFELSNYILRQFNIVKNVFIYDFYFRNIMSLLYRIKLSKQT